MSTRIDVADGKYSVIIEDNGGLSALRYGEPWRDLTGDKLVYCLAEEVNNLRQIFNSTPRFYEAIARVRQSAANLGLTVAQYEELENKTRKAK